MPKPLATTPGAQARTKFCNSIVPHLPAKNQELLETRSPLSLSSSEERSQYLAPAAKPTLWGYQKNLRLQLYQVIQAGKKRVLLFAPTGAGKTVLSAQFVADAVFKERRVLFVVDLDVLIPQTWEKFKKFGLECGFIKAGWQENREALVQIASAQTLPRRGWWREFNPEIVVLDECHKTAWKSVIKKMMAEDCPDAIYIGLTATPWRLSKREGMGDIFEAIVAAPMPWELMQMGFLVKPVYYGIKGADLKNVRTVAGDFAETDLAIACNRSEVVGCIVKEWLRFCQGRRTICFAVNIAHSKAIRDAFLQIGVTAEHVDGSMTSKQRAAIYARLASGETLVLSSCGVLQEGFDVPSVSAILLCRPTKSKALYFQQVGRGLRISPETEKTDCLVLDQAGNVKRFGFIEDLKQVRLTTGIDEEPGVAPTKDCPACEAILHLSVMICSCCGYNFPEKEKLKPIQQLERILSKEDKLKFDFFRSQILLGYQKQHAPGWAAFRFKDEHELYPPDDWRRSAIFGDKPTEQDREDYWQFLIVTANRKGKSQAWVARQWHHEFGFEGGAANG